MVSGDHGNSDANFSASGDRLRSVRAWRVLKPDQPEQLQFRLGRLGLAGATICRPRGDGDHPQPSLGHRLEHIMSALCL
jgi:hypothetical protein